MSLQEEYLQQHALIQFDIQFFERIMQQCTYSTVLRLSVAPKQQQFISQEQLKQAIKDIIKIPKQFLEYERKNSIKEAKRKKIYTSMNLRGPYRSYSQIQKLQAVNMHFHGSTFSEISHTLRIPQKNVARWCKEGWIKLNRVGRRTLNKDMETVLLEWMSEQLVQPSETQIRNKARIFSNCEQFKASRGWFNNFTRRYNIQSRH